MSDNAAKNPSDNGQEERPMDIPEEGAPHLEATDSDSNESEESAEAPAAAPTFTPFERRGAAPQVKGDKRFLYYADVGKDFHLESDRTLAERNLDNFIIQRRETQEKATQCCSSFSSSIKQKKCTCISKFSALLAQEYQENGHTATLDKWCPLLEPLVRLVKELKVAATADATDDRRMGPETLVHLLEVAHPFSKGVKGNSVMDYVIDFGGKKIILCHTFFWDLGGHIEGKPGPDKFLKLFLNTNRMQKKLFGDNWQSYFRLVVLPKANTLVISGFFLDICIEQKKIPSFDHKDKKTCISKLEILTMMAEEIKMNNKNEPIQESEKSCIHKWLTPCKLWIEEWRKAHFLVVAHPNMESFPSIPDSEVKVVFNLHGKPATDDIPHFGNAGTVSLEGFVDMLQAINIGSVEQRTTRTRMLRIEANEGYGDCLARTLLYFPEEGNAMLALAHHLLIPNANDLPVQAFMGKVAESCQALLPPTTDGNNVEYNARGWADLLVSTRVRLLGDFSEPYDHLAQVPHSIDTGTINRLTPLGIRVFSCTIPLSKCGAWLRVFPDGSADKTLGKMVFVPFGTMYIQPIATVHSGGYRFSFNGNRRVQMLVYLVPKTLSKEQIAAARMGDRYRRKYFHALVSANPTEGNVYKLAEGGTNPQTKRPIMDRVCQVMGY